MSDENMSSPIDQYVINFVLRLRKDKHQTQDDIAEILQVSRSFVKDVENLNNRAKYNLTHINALADYFAMSPGDFLPAKAIPVTKSRDEKSKKKSSASTKDQPAGKRGSKPKKN
jgi:transcriptional regulator with XRE-family HTH domain